MIISMREAMAILGEKQAMHSDAFCEKYMLNRVPTNIRHGKGMAALFKKEEVEERALSLKKVMENQGKAYLDGQQVTRLEFVEALERMEKKIDRLLAAFDLPVHDA